MSCPYLTEVTMSFCRAFPVKKLVPSDSVITESPCDGESYASCPVYRDAAHAPAAAPRPSGAAAPEPSHGAVSKGGGS